MVYPPMSHLYESRFEVKQTDLTLPLREAKSHDGFTN